MTTDYLVFHVANERPADLKPSHIFVRPEDFAALLSETRARIRKDAGQLAWVAYVRDDSEVPFEKTDPVRRIKYDASTR